MSSTEEEDLVNLMVRETNRFARQSNAVRYDHVHVYIYIYIHFSKIISKKKKYSYFILFYNVFSAGLKPLHKR